MNIKTFLTRKAVQFEVLSHRPTFDAQHLAHALHVSGKEVAKTVLLRADSGFRYLVAVLPASSRVDLQKASEALGGSHLEIASEDELMERCPDCELGVLPPFGSQYDMTTLVDRSFMDDEMIVFEGNLHNEAIRMRFDDFRRIEEPLIAAFAVSEQHVK